MGPYRRRRESVVKNVGPALFCFHDYSSQIAKTFEPWKKWLLQLKLLCGIVFFWPWAARGLSGSFENVIEYQKSATVLCSRLLERVVKYVGPYRRRRESVVKYMGPARFCCQE